MTGDEELVSNLTNDHRLAEISAQDTAMLNYAAKLTLKPWDMQESDVEELRQSGFSDTAILDICQVTAYFAYVNRLADGLGVELESCWEVP